MPYEIFKIKRPYISEKSSGMADSRRYVFHVSKNANKTEIKKAIEKIYGVRISKVGVITVPGKRKRLGRTQGFRPGFKKAIVTLKEGKIEIA